MVYSDSLFVVIPALIKMMGFEAFLPKDNGIVLSLELTLKHITILIGSIIFLIIWCRPSHQLSYSTKDQHQLTTKKNTIQTLHELRNTIPAGSSGTNFNNAKKVIPYLDEQMVGFIERSPFLQLSTINENGYPFISPKGDEPGFVTVITSDKYPKSSTLIIPDRPGNRLLFGLQNILDNPKVGILFEIPNTNTTLRCGGIASLSKDPKLLQCHIARKSEPRVVLVIQISYAFFHCAKSYMRAQLWDTNIWPAEEYAVKFGQYFVPRLSKIAQKIDDDVQNKYCQIQKAIKGEDGGKDTFD